MTASPSPSSPTTETPKADAPKTAPSGRGPVLRLAGVRKSYNVGTPVEVEVLHGIDLTVERGAFIAVNVGYVLVMVPMIFASALPGQYGRWLWRGVLLPGALSILVAVAGRALVPDGTALVAQLAASGLTGLCGLAACLLVLPEARDTAATLYRRLRRRVDPAAR